MGECWGEGCPVTEEGANLRRCAHDHRVRPIALGDMSLRSHLRLDGGIGGKCDFIGFVDRRRLGLLLCSIVARLQICRFQLVHAIQHAIKSGLKAQIGANFGGALQQQVDGTVKMLFGRVLLTGGVPV